MNTLNRRLFLRAAGTGLLACAAARPAAIAAPRSAAHPLKLGMASVSFRRFPLDAAIEMTLRLDLKHISLKSMHLPLEASDAVVAATVRKVRAAGLDVYGGGVIDMKTREEMDRAFTYARAAGFRTIIGLPAPELLGTLEQKVREFDIRVAIHNHGPEDNIFPGPDEVMRYIERLDRRIGLCIDVGHTFRYKQDPAALIEKHGSRVYDIHLKDFASLSRADKAAIGRGQIDIPAILRSLQKIRYDGIVALEYEDFPNDPLPGAAESIGYTRGVLRML